MKNIIFLCLLLLGYTGCSKEQPSPNSPKIVWKTKLLENTKSEGSFNPVLYNDLVIYSTTPSNGNPNTIIALNKNNGTKVWEWKDAINTSIFISFAVTYVKDNILIVCAKRDVYAIDMNSGKTIWKNSVPDGAYDVLNGFGDYIFHHRSALSKTTASIVMANIHDGNWRTIYADTPKNGKTIIFSPFHIIKNLQGDTVITFSRNVSEFDYSKTLGFLTKYNLTKDSVIFNKQMSDYPLDLYFYKRDIMVLSNKELAYYDTETMNKKWIEYNYVPRAVTNDGIVIGEVFSNFTSDKDLKIIQIEGMIRLLDIKNFKTSIQSNALIQNNTLYFSNGTFHAYEMKMGNQIWELNSSNRFSLFDRILTIDKEKDRIYTASYSEAICFEAIK